MSGSLNDLPPEVAELIGPHLDLDPTVLGAIGVELAGKRDEAKSARSSSGIESAWREAEEAYLGIDDANRHEFSGDLWVKPMSSDGPVTTGRQNRNVEHKSTVFLPLTTRYVNAGSAKLSEILMPADDKAFSFSEMPVPELIAAKEDESQVVHSGLGVPLTRPLKPGEIPAPGGSSVNAQASPLAPSATANPIAQPMAGPAPAPGGATPGPAPQGTGAPAGAQPQPPQVPLTVKDFAVEKIELARKQAKAAETRIYDWMIQTRLRAEIRKLIADSARIGVGVLKGPIPQSTRAQVLKKNDADGSVTLEFKEKIIPASVRVSAWNIYPDPACGDNIHDGDYVFEVDHFSAKKVRGLKKLPGYIGSQIDKVLEEGPNKVNTINDRRPSQASDKALKNRFEIWYYYGILNKEEMLAINQAVGDKKTLPEDPPEEAYAIVTLINDSVVRAAINPLDSGSFPYHSMPWQPRAEHWAGTGVGEQMRSAQKITNAALRAMLNNAGKSAGSQIVLNQAAIRPADGVWSVTPDKLWLVTNDGPDDIRKAFMAIEIPNMTQQLLEIITTGERFAEESTSIPLITQGQSGQTTPDTYGGAQLQNNNANQLLRDIGYAFDDYITEPLVRQYYEWLLLDPDVPNEEKGEFQVDAHGSVALIERAIQDQTIAQMGQMAVNPAFGIDPKKWATEFLRSKKLSPDKFQYTEEEQAKMAAAPPPVAPAVQAAQIAADAQIKMAVMKQPIEQQNAQAEQQIATAAHVLEVGKVQVDQQQAHIDGTLKANQLEMEHQRAMMDFATKKGISLDQAKVQLAKTSMQLQTEERLNAVNTAVDLHKHRNPQPPMPKPPAQVPGRAGNGRAFSQAGPAQ